MWKRGYSESPPHTTTRLKLLSILAHERLVLGGRNDSSKVAGSRGSNGDLSRSRLIDIYTEAHWYKIDNNQRSPSFPCAFLSDKDDLDHASWNRSDAFCKQIDKVLANCRHALLHHCFGRFFPRIVRYMELVVSKP